MRKQPKQQQVCEQVVHNLQARRSGDLTTLERQRIDAHLQHCATCRAEWLLLKGISNAAKAFAAVPTDEQRERMWQAIRHEVVLSAAPPVQKRRWWVLPAFAVPALATAAAVLWLALLPGQSAAPKVIRVAGTSAGVDAVAVDASGVESFEVDGAPHLRVQRGTLYVAFKRPPGGQPLVVLAPRVRVWVRGTSLAVRASALQTSVLVQTGVVEVQTIGKGTHSVRAGEQVVVDDANLSPQAANESWSRELRHHLFSGVSESDAAAAHAQETPTGPVSPGVPAAPPSTSNGMDADGSEAATETPAPTPSAQRASRRRALGSRPGRRLSPGRGRSAAGGARSSAHSVPAVNADSIGAPSIARFRKGLERTKQQASEDTSAQQAWQQLLEAARAALNENQPKKCLQLLEGIPATNMPPHAREHSLYLQASAERALGRYKRAVSTLKKLTRSSRSEESMLAQLEIARILRYNLDDPQEALRVLGRLLQYPGRAWVRQEAWIERCTLYAEKRQLQQAQACLDGMLRQFPATHHKKTIERLRKDLTPPPKAKTAP